MSYYKVLFSATGTPKHHHGENLLYSGVLSLRFTPQGYLTGPFIAFFSEEH